MALGAGLFLFRHRILKLRLNAAGITLHVDHEPARLPETFSPSTLGQAQNWLAQIEPQASHLPQL